MRVLRGLSPGRRMMIGAAALVALIAVLVVGYLLLSGTVSSAEDDQPIAFNHQIHAQNGVQCQYCHNDVTRGPVAGLPSVYLCMGCHQAVATDSQEIQKLTTYWENEDPIEWVRVHRQPSFVHFNHAVHVTNDVNCGACHGDVATMSVAEQVVDMDMGFCLDCHEEVEGTTAGRLYDCATCHY